MTTRDDQPPGVLESLGGGRVRVHPRHPQWEGDPTLFDELYKLVGEVVVPLTGPTPKGVRIGDANPYGVPRSPVDTFVDWKSSRVRVDS